MTASLFDEVEGKPVRLPREGVMAGGRAPVWTDYKVKVPVDCDHCVQVAYETSLAGEPFPGMRKARRKRRQGGVSLLLCSEHAQAQAALDEAAAVDPQGGLF